MNEISQGFRTVLPLWLASAPVAIAYSITAREAGLNPLEIQIMSLTLYSATAQMSLVQLSTAGASMVPILLTVVMMNLHFVIYGLSLAKRIKLSGVERVAAASLLTDSAYGVTIAARENPNFAFLFGAELSLFLGWNLSTALGILVGHLVTIPAWAHLDFLAPLTFFILLTSSLKTWSDVVVAAFSVATAIVCLSMQLGSITILIVGLMGAFIGSWMINRQNSKRTLLEIEI
jgi:predicted branched-subunit amino acid permease